MLVSSLSPSALNTDAKTNDAGSLKGGKNLLISSTNVSTKS